VGVRDAIGTCESLRPALPTGRPYW